MGIRDYLKLNVGQKNDRDRQDWVVDKLNKLPKGARILDAGAGELRYKAFCGHLRYVAQDFGQYNGEGDTKALQTGAWDKSKLDIICDIINIPEPDQSFDAIMCIEVLEHLPEPLLAIKEFSRLLKKDGVLILTAPFCSLTHFSPFFYSTGFSRYYYEKHLKFFNFEIKELTPNGNYYEFIAQELFRLPTIASSYSKKELNFFHKFLIYLLLLLIQRLNKIKNYSDELLCYGYHVVALNKPD